MDLARRVFIKQSTIAGSATLALVCGHDCWARWGLEAFDHQQADRAMLELLQGEGAVRSNELQLSVPEQNQNPALVPVAVSWTLSDVKSISIMVDSPFDPLAATFTLGSLQLARLSTRLNLEQSTRIWAFAESAEGYAVSNRPVKLLPFSSKPSTPAQRSPGKTLKQRR